MLTMLNHLSESSSAILLIALSFLVCLGLVATLPLYMSKRAMLQSPVKFCFTFTIYLHSISLPPSLHSMTNHSWLVFMLLVQYTSKVAVKLPLRVGLTLGDSQAFRR